MLTKRLPRTVPACQTHVQDNPGDIITLHRCRLYRIGPPDKIFTEGRFTEVWDTLDQPYERTGPLPKGEVVAEENNSVKSAVREAISKYRKQHRIITAGSWRYRGMAG
jgi:hypothetical protein